MARSALELIETPTSPEALEFPPFPEVAREITPEPSSFAPAPRLARAPLMVGAVVGMAVLVGLVFLNTPPRLPPPAPAVAIPSPPLRTLPVAPEPVAAPPVAISGAPSVEMQAALAPTPTRRPTRPPAPVAPKTEPVPLAPATAPVVAIPIPLPSAPPPAREMLLRPAILPPTDPEAPLATRARTPD